MKKTTEIHEALRQRRNIESEILDLNFRIEILQHTLEKKYFDLSMLNFELLDWDIYERKTKNNENNSIE